MKNLIYIFMFTFLSGCCMTANQQQGVLKASDINTLQQQIQESPPPALSTPESTTLTPIPEEILKKL